MHVTIDRQDIRIDVSRIVIAAGSIEFVPFEFSFSDDWYGYIKTAQFSQGGHTYNQLLVDDRCFLPAEIADGNFILSVFGADGSSASRATSAHLLLHAIHPGFVGNSEPAVPPTPDLYSQLLDQLQIAIRNAYADFDLRQDILGTMATPTLDAYGRVTRIDHVDIATGDTVRVDEIAYDGDVVTEVRTLFTGQTLTQITNLDTLTVNTAYDGGA